MQSKYLDVLETSRKINLTVFFAIIIVFLSSAAAAEIYKWVDSNGTTHYSSKAPDNQTVKILKLSTAKPDPEAKSHSLPVPQAEKLNSPTVRSNRAIKFSKQSSAKKNIGEYGHADKITDENFDRKNLQKADFSKRSIRKTTFNQSRMKGASFKSAELLELLSFKNADLSGADFSHAFINRVDFSGANLTGANFDFSSCFECKFDNAQLIDSQFSQTTINNSTFDHADVRNAKFSVVTWAKVSLIGAKNLNYEQIYQEVRNNPSSVSGISYDYNGCVIGIAGADCSGKDLSGHNFFASELRDTNFSKANLSNANFELISLTNVNFSQAKLMSASFGKTVQQSNFNSADLTGADFQNTPLQNGNFNQAKLDGIKFNPAIINPSVILHSDLNGCKKCRDLVKSAHVDFDSLKGDIVEFSARSEKPSSSDYSKWIKFQRQYAIFISSRSTLSIDQHIELITLLLNKNNPLYVKDTFFLINGLAQQGLQETVCKNRQVINLVLPLISLSSKEFDSKIKKTRGNLTPSEQIRHDAISCLLSNFPSEQTVTLALKKYFRSESSDHIKVLLLAAYKDGSEKSEQVLINAIKSGHEKTARLAAVYLKESPLLPVSLKPWLLNYIETEKYADDAFYELLQNYPLKERPNISRLIEIENMRKRNKWSTTDIKDLIRSFKNDIKKLERKNV